MSPLVLIISSVVPVSAPVITSWLELVTAQAGWLVYTVANVMVQLVTNPLPIETIPA